MPPAPLLFVDTCSLLDLVRDPTRDVDLGAMTAAVDRLQDAAQDDRLEIMLPEQVEVELDRNLPAVEEESRRALKRFWAIAQHVEDGLAEFGMGDGVTYPRGSVATARANDVQDLRRARVEEWRRLATRIDGSDTVRRRAVQRLNDRRPPAHEKKTEFADCLIIETVLEWLERHGDPTGRRPTVFLSANTADYRAKDAGGYLRPPLDEEFETRGLWYAAHFGQACQLLLGGGAR